VAAYRTPDERFDGLPGWNFQPRYLQQDGLRMHWVDEGAGDPVLLLHGEPTWGYLYRKLIPTLAGAGGMLLVARGWLALHLRRRRGFRT
jgi:haloalkane dehalogenase